MPIKAQTGNIDEYISERIAAMERALVYNLSYIGEQVLNAARSTNSYKDQTGNLRSSIGYVIAMDGEVVKQSDFAVVKTGTQGQDTGRSYAEGLAAKFSKGVVLIVVAGMNYAYYVKKRGYDVIDSAELLADSLVPKMLHELGFNS